MTTNLHDKMLASIDAYFSASGLAERDQAEKQLLTDEKYEAIVEDLADWRVTLKWTRRINRWRRTSDKC